MKNFSADLQTHLDSGTTTLCWCWKIVRNDGTVQGFTDHDVPVAFDGVTYEAASGFTASEVQSTLGLAVDEQGFGIEGSSSSENDPYSPFAIRYSRVLEC